MSTCCLGSGADFVGRRPKVFCTNACQQSHRRRLLLQAWLDSGVCGRMSYQGHNRRENLRLICPNCDSQLPTYKARNRGSGRHYRRQRYANGQSY
ncbi:hypothetical protein PT015_14985 [Candidatus Mycobacterium wuenschmannii]|uniref:HNH endonuclease n=1 Tax=Candidatus Mycobacterium wuenschmannii TaxID=3027808 RepID=A0ABY8VXG0_9MYCO|nr:hypothetical protein [Candidatus Mycobacterium wuenschmannii]WIM86214.1 hypothetical protein PT015_14985 [Candidatus Mycobacterium wuenschmannii]